jgi:hypothetical protein
MSTVTKTEKGKGEMRETNLMKAVQLLTQQITAARRHSKLACAQKKHKKLPPL